MVRLFASVRRDEVALMVTLDRVRRAMAHLAQRFDAEASREKRNTVFLRDVAYRIRARSGHARTPPDMGLT